MSGARQPVTAVLVSYRSAGFIRAAIESCLPVCSEVLVVDNAPGDGTAEVVQRYPQVRILTNGKNLGFAGGVNWGFREAANEFVLLLNPDAELLRGLDAMVALASRPEVAVVGGSLIGADGSFQRGFAFRRLPDARALAFEVLGFNRLFPGNAVNRRYRCLDEDPGRRQQVEQPAGAFLLTRKSVWREVGGFDEQFDPVWFEDVDYCARVRRRGYQIWFEPQAAARHAGGHAARQMDWGERERIWYVSLLVYARKHFTRRGYQGVCLAVIGGCFARAAGSVVCRRSAEPLRIYAKVVRLAWRGLLAKEGARGGPSAGRSGGTTTNQAHLHVL